MSIPPLAFVHLGAHKTGSTLLQSVWDAEAGSLAAAGIAWIPRRTFHARFSRATPAWRRNPETAVPEMHAALARLLPGGAPRRALLVSDEGLLGHLRTDLGNAPERLYEHCGEVPRLLKRAMGREGMVLLLFIRRLDGFLPAAYLQRVRLGETASFAAYLRGLALDRLSWVPTVRELAEALDGPADRLVVYDHALLQAAPGALLGDLFGRLGAPAPRAEVLARRVNPSLTARRYRAMMALNRAWPAGRLPWLRVLPAGLIDLRWPSGGPPARLIEPALAARLAARHAEDLAAIAAMGGKVELALPSYLPTAAATIAQNRPSASGRTQRSTATTPPEGQIQV